MDFNQRILKAYPGNFPLPYYMAYPGYEGADDVQRLMKDLDYLQETYPAEVLKLQKKISELVDRLDYEGSMIYDEYPDRLQLQKMAENITKVCEEDFCEMKSDFVAQVLLCNEVYRRRQRQNRNNHYLYRGFPTEWRLE